MFGHSAFLIEGVVENYQDSPLSEFIANDELKALGTEPTKFIAQYDIVVAKPKFSLSTQPQSSITIRPYESTVKHLKKSAIYRNYMDSNNAELFNLHPVDIDAIYTMIKSIHANRDACDSSRVAVDDKGTFEYHMFPNLIGDSKSIERINCRTWVNKKLLMIDIDQADCLKGSKPKYGLSLCTMS